MTAGTCTHLGKCSVLDTFEQIEGKKLAIHYLKLVCKVLKDSDIRNKL